MAFQLDFNDVQRMLSDPKVNTQQKMQALRMFKQSQSSVANLSFNPAVTARSAMQSVAAAGRVARGLSPLPGGLTPGKSGAASQETELSSEFQKALDEANAANEARSKLLREGHQARFDRNMERVERIGEQEIADSRERFQSRANAAEQDLISRGISNSTVTPTVRAGFGRQADAEESRIRDRILRTQVTTDAALSGDLLAQIEREEDIGPEFNLLARLAQLEGRARQVEGNSPLARGGFGSGGGLITFGGGGTRLRRISGNGGFTPIGGFRNTFAERMRRKRARLGGDAGFGNVPATGADTESQEFFRRFLQGTRVTEGPVRRIPPVGPSPV